MAGWMILCSLLALACLWLLVLRLLDARRLKALYRQASAFAADPRQPMDISLAEDDIAMVHNTLCELQELLLRQRQLQQEEHRGSHQLAADLSHQLKTPLTTLRLYTELDAAPHMEGSLQQIGRMEQLVQSLLRLERLCANDYAFRFVPWELSLLIHQEWQDLQPLYPGRKLSLQGQGLLRCDSQWLGEAFRNLLKNACEHMPPGGELRVTLEQGEASLFCTLEDNGGGVPGSDLPHLFQRFYRGSCPTGEGFGLGLAIAREILRRHHGSITAENTPAGLKLTITFMLLDLNMPVEPD